MTTQPTTLLTQSDSDFVSLVTEAGRDFATMRSCSAQIADLDPLTDAPRLRRLWTRLRTLVRRPRADGRDDQALAAARALLDEVTARQSPAGAALHDLLESEPGQFTPAVLNALWQIRDGARSGADLTALLPEKAAAHFIAHDLVRAGAVVRATPASANAAKPLDLLGADRYRLTPAGEHALGAIARRVLEAELGRFEWPASVPDLSAWASENSRSLFTFHRDGRDGEAVARCIGAEGSEIGSLSVPSLFGVASPKVEAAPYDSIAVLLGNADTWDEQRVNDRMARILDDHRKLAERTTRPRHDAGPHWKLVLFADRGLIDSFHNVLDERCKHAHVDHEFA